MSALFFGHYCYGVGTNVSARVLEVLNGRLHPKCINQTYVTVIPKVKAPQSPKDFRPISLENVIYKLVSKVLVDCLKEVLPPVIHESQIAFFLAWMIINTAITAFEHFYHMKKKRQNEGNDNMCLKLDMSKVYHRVEWDHLEKVILRMGFDGSWVNLVMNCISSVSYSILVTRQPVEFFSPLRGLHQRDPLSPYLFPMCTEGLSALIIDLAARGELHGTRASKSALVVTHLSLRMIVCYF